MVSVFGFVDISHISFHTLYHFYMVIVLQLLSASEDSFVRVWQLKEGNPMPEVNDITDIQNYGP